MLRAGGRIAFLATSDLCQCVVVLLVGILGSGPPRKETNHTRGDGTVRDLKGAVVAKEFCS